MPRKGPVPKREILPDPIYGSRLVARFVNRLMHSGKKGVAEKILYSSLEQLAEKANVNRSLLNQLETGKLKNTSINTLQKIADTLNCKITELFI